MAAQIRVTQMTLSATAPTPPAAGAKIRVTQMTLSATAPTPGPLSFYYIRGDGVFVPLTLQYSTTASGGTWVT